MTEWDRVAFARHPREGIAVPDTVTHPTAQELAAFGLGKLPEHAAAAVAAHLGVCHACRQAARPGDRTAPPAQPPGTTASLGTVPAARPDGSSSPPGLSAKAAPCPNLPPELASHPKYRILRELGRGGMGVVYQARQTGMMVRPVVIKVISRALLDHPDALERFRREVQAAAQLSHPNIVTAYDAEQAGDLHMLVMEFVPGQSLAEVLHKKGPLPVADACHAARQVALGLQHAFERGMVHRDIKPHNLMLMPDGQVKILDFGLAKAVSERGAGAGLTASGSYMGTPDYSAPEQATDARTADIRADLYSLGCTLYCLLAGRPPFHEDTAMKTVLAHLHREPRPLPELRPDVPAELWQVVRRLLAKDPARRYQRPAEVAQALTPFVQAGPVPGAGTAVPADTGRFEDVLRVATVPGEAPAREAATEAVVPAEEAKSAPASWYRRRPVLAAVGAAVLALGLGAWLLAGVVFKTRVKTPAGEAYVVLEIDQPDAEVTVDGQKIRVQVPGDNKPVEIEVEPGRPHKLRVRKDGFQVVSRDVELKAGESAPIRVRLEPVDQPAAPRPAPAGLEKERPATKTGAPPAGDGPRNDAAEMAKLTQVLQRHTWFYHDNLFPPGENCRFNADGTFHTYRWKYWVVGPRVMRVHYDRRRDDKANGIPFTFNQDLTRFTAEFTDPNGRVHKIIGTRR